MKHVQKRLASSKNARLASSEVALVVPGVLNRGDQCRGKDHCDESQTGKKIDHRIKLLLGNFESLLPNPDNPIRRNTCKHNRLRMGKK